jgi:hypothetical protein
MDRGLCIAGDWRVSEVAWVEHDLRFKRALAAAIKASDERAEHWPLGVIGVRRFCAGSIILCVS